jgi:hypothetical protein
MGSDLGLMRGPNHPISDNVAFRAKWEPVRAKYPVLGQRKGYWLV